ncbi:neuronal pentraxin-1 [Pimephales promelas]|uniref:neuronal pentraxin-1 n=1 Tax=Pimephales promelas TaxID=90988 RepID=UPI001955BACD|nr:neuronal pentraxin-1 [Pimephales promelas]XP_039508156.1 neuronal pentraxin-1 [Pimephales promelas]XP_039508157.1 neuronal pentraxin-1 [Pimephales promelas]XP_039508158.1 neuronal pentraxin-1 [Pimephales promelas]XP_039508159.1 neuronal pentraxin-1 [Pimephales promelas]KAG1960559.1 neuronal pentraxin-2 [Pimephales promelas]
MTPFRGAHPTAAKEKSMMTKNTNYAIMSLPFSEHIYWGGIFKGLYLPSRSLFLLLLLFSSPSVAFSSVPGLEYDWGTQPKLVCIPIPADADPGCFTPGGALHGDSHGDSHGASHGASHGHGNGHHGPVSSPPSSHSSSSSRHGISDEAKSTILHLRESLVRQKETILDQRETIRELTAKLTLCESFGRGHHDDSHHGPSHHNSQHSSHPFDSHHGDPHFPLNGHRSDHHRGKTPYLGKHGGFSPEQTGKTLQALKERLENLQARNSSSSYSSSLRDLLQRKINALEEQLHHHYDSHYGHHENHHGYGHHEDHHDLDDHHNTHSNNHHDDHHDDHHDNHDDHHDNHDNHQANHHDDHHSSNHRNNNHYNYHYERHSDHHDDHHDNHQNGHDDHHDNHHNSNHHEDRHDDGHHGNGHHDDGRHGNDDNVHHPQTSFKPPGPRAPVRGALSKLDAVLSNLHHKTPEPGLNKKLKNPDAFQIGFPMRTNYMYGRIKRTLLSEIFALTVCLWLKGGSGPGIGTPFSYSVPGQANELVLIEWGNNPMELLVNDKAVTLPISLTDSKWHHLCVTWSTRDGMWEAYQDGVKRGSGENLSPWHPIKPGGVFILGQEQDTLGGRFDATQSFVGEMSDLQLWSRMLTSTEIYDQASCSSHLTGDIITWSESMVELHGGVTKYPFDPCH